MSAETIEAIRARKRPEFGRDDERVIFDLVTELISSKKVSPATFQRAEAALGRNGIIETVSCAGFYGIMDSCSTRSRFHRSRGGDVLT